MLKFDHIDSFEEQQNDWLSKTGRVYLSSITSIYEWKLNEFVSEYRNKKKCIIIWDDCEDIDFLLKVVILLFDKTFIISSSNDYVLLNSSFIGRNRILNRYVNISNYLALGKYIANTLPIMKKMNVIFSPGCKQEINYQIEGRKHDVTVIDPFELLVTSKSTIILFAKNVNNIVLSKKCILIESINLPVLECSSLDDFTDVVVGNEEGVNAIRECMMRIIELFSDRSITANDVECTGINIGKIISEIDKKINLIKESRGFLQTNSRINRLKIDFYQINEKYSNRFDWKEISQLHDSLHLNNRDSFLEIDPIIFIIHG